MKRRPIGEVIREARLDAGLSQHGVCRLIELRTREKRHLDVAGLSRLEAGIYQPSYKTLVSLAIALKGRFIINEDGAVFRAGKGREK